MRFFITALDKIRDVVEAEDKESAEKIFRAKYPATVVVLDVSEASNRDHHLVRDAVDLLEHAEELDQGVIDSIVRNLKKMSVYKKG